MMVVSVWPSSQLLVTMPGGSRTGTDSLTCIRERNGDLIFQKLCDGAVVAMETTPAFTHFSQRQAACWHPPSGERAASGAG